MVKRVKSSLPPVLPVGWGSHSSLNFNKLPFGLLTKSERRFLQSLCPNPFGSSQPLFSRKDFLFLLREFSMIYSKQIIYRKFKLT
ncbi:MAG: hypothetical protein ACTSXA_03200 [Candidatus Heimdallarchaeota archaeon]